MSVAARLWPGVAKETRALAGLWLACLCALVFSTALDPGALRGLFQAPVYFLGCATLGALSMGHEYSHQTLPLLLAHPAHRARLLLVKLGVLAAMLLTLDAVAVAVVVLRQPMSAALPFAVLPPLCGLLVAPWLTMLSRNPVAGTVFTIGAHGTLLIAGELLYFAVNGRGPGQAAELTLLLGTTLALFAVVGVMTWRTFMRLEALEGDPELPLPRWLPRRAGIGPAARAFTRHRPLWLLLKKEVRLHRLAAAVAGFHALFWFASTSVRSVVVLPDNVLAALTFFYGALIALLAGAVASAEERRLGTLESQLLLPLAVWKQWTVKVAVAIGVALALALGLPWLLAALLRPGMTLAPLPQPWPALGVAALTVISLYVSSLCTSALRALLLSVPAAVAIGLGVIAVIGWRLSGVVEALLAAAATALVLRLAFVNHRSTVPRAWTQPIVTVIGLSAGALLVRGLTLFS